MKAACSHGTASYMVLRWAVPISQDKANRIV
jgi:hypothetical protein